MTAEPQTGFPPQQAQFSGYSGDAPSGLQYQPPPPPPPDQQSFAGYATDAPSGLSYAAPGNAAPGNAAPGYAAPGYAAPGYAAPGYAAPGYGASGHAEQSYVQQQGYAPEPAPQTAYAPPPQAAYPPPPPPQEAYPPPQAAYPDPNLGRQPGDLPGYLQPYPAAAGFTGKGPSVGPVVAFTIFFGVFGMFSAMRRAKRAEAVGDSPGKYWMAWGITFALGWVLGVVISLVMLALGVFAVAATSDASTAAPVHPITASSLSKSMVQQGTVAGNGETIRVKTATCAASTVDDNGVGTYKCAISLTDGTKETVLVRADATGWRVLGQTK